jgi:hypothetical protein
VLEVCGWPLVLEPLLEGAVEALELPERLRMGGCGVDQLDADLSQLALEGHLEPVEAAGEAQVVVREQLPGYPVGGAGGHEAGPGRLAAQAVHRERGQQEAGVVIDDVDHPGRPLTGERDLSRVDLPEVVDQLALETPPRLDPARRLRRDQVVALERLVDRRHRRRLDPGAGQLGVNPPRAPTRVPLAQLHDSQLERRRDLHRRAARPPRPLGQAGSALVQIPPPVAVVARPRDAVTRAHLGHRFAGAPGLKQHRQLQRFHRHHPQSHPSLPLRITFEAETQRQIGQNAVSQKSRNVSDVSGTNVSDVSGTIRLRSLRT